MDCPRGHGPLGETKVDELLLDRCGACGGIWLDFAQLERILNRDSRGLSRLMPEVSAPLSPEQEGQQTMPCPRCQGTLLRMCLQPEMIHYYSCITCYGRWLDGREIRRILAKPLSAKFESLFRQLLD